MPWKSSPDIWGIVAALIISAISGFISISRRVLSGHTASVLWVLCEFITALLCGYLMYDAYPIIKADVPKWFTMPVAIVTAAHIGGKLFREMEDWFIRRQTIIQALNSNHNPTVPSSDPVVPPPSDEV